jgi:antitoxin component of MazEF toxin-antitoxin module
MESEEYKGQRRGEHNVIYGKVRRAGNSFVVTIPREEMAAQGISEGDVVAIDVRPAEVHPALSPRLRKAADASWERNKDAYRHLAEH